MKSLLLFLWMLISGLYGYAQCYSINDSAIYDPDDYEAGTLITFQPGINYPADDAFSEKIPIGFPFCFYGNSYDSLLVSPNGYLIFNDTLAGAYSCYIPGLIPNPSNSWTNAKNAIMFPWTDYFNGNVRYITNGVYPNRTFVVSFDSVEYYHTSLCTSSYYLFTGQVKLYETSNKVEINLLHSVTCYDAALGFSTLGLHNADGTMSEVPYRSMFSVYSGWNHAMYMANDQSFVFTPICNACAVSNTSIEDEILQPEPHIYPNPASNHVIVTSLYTYPVIVKIFNSLAKEIAHYQIPENGTIKVDDLEGGIYFLVFSNKGKVLSTQKLMITNN